jgi:hypothetical protein
MLVLLLDDAIPLKGFYRIRPGQPGFAIPVFENNGQLVVQHVGTGGTIDGFLPCDLDVDQLLPVPKDIGAEPLYSRVGTEPLYGFQNLDGTLIYGSRDKLLLLLHPVSAQLADRPFLSLEIAQFLEDEVLINENRARTQSLLRRHARDPIKFERFIDTELTARSVPEAAKWSRTIDYLLFFVLFFVFLGGYGNYFLRSSAIYAVGEVPSSHWSDRRHQLSVCADRPPGVYPDGREGHAPNLWYGCHACGRLLLRIHMCPYLLLVALRRALVVPHPQDVPAIPIVVTARNAK